MPVRIERHSEGFKIEGFYDGNMPPVPAGYRPLAADETLIVGQDLAFNVITEQWEPVTEVAVWTAALFGGDPKRLFRFPPVRKSSQA